MDRIVRGKEEVWKRNGRGRYWVKRGYVRICEKIFVRIVRICESAF